MDENANTILRLNDAFRTKQDGAGKIMLTNGIMALGDNAIPEVCSLVAAFDDFSPDNDPHGEHDFGSFEFREKTVFFKFDYYNLDLTAGSKDPANPNVTTRVLTIMLAEEY